MARPRPLEAPVTMAFLPARPRSTGEILAQGIGPHVGRSFHGPQKTGSRFRGRKRLLEESDGRRREGGFGGPAPVRHPTLPGVPAAQTFLSQNFWEFPV